MTEETATETPTEAPAAAPTGKIGLVSLVLGGISLVAWMVPIAGAPLAAVGMLAGLRGLGTPRKGAAVAGVVMSFLGLVFSATLIYTMAKVGGGK